jgi:Telomeric repeat-binding factor 2.
MHKWFNVGAVLLIAVATAGCSNTTTPAPASSSQPVVSAQATTSAPAAAMAVIGQELSNRGVTLTVKAARAVDTIDMNESNYRPGSGHETYTKTKPEAGGKFIVVETHVVNNAKVSMDLTCSLPITTKVVDDKDRNFDPIQSLYKVKGNPECNKQLQPGFESDMTYVYLVPTNATVIKFGFYDSTDFNGRVDWSRVQLAI